MKNFINRHDNILHSITYDDIITAVQSNEPEINEKAVKKVFNEILETALQDAKYSLKHDMEFILNECKED